MTIPTQYLNQEVFVRVDRPLNSQHPKYHFTYPVNYGFIPDTKSGDGEEIDAYILGVNESLKEFKGKCIAIIHRINDNDDKLVVVPDGMNVSDPEIDRLTEFQEKWFRHSIVRNPVVTRTHKGVYAVIRKGNQVLVIKKARGPYTGLYDLPGGSPEKGETPEQTVTREIKEETSCDLVRANRLWEKTIFFSDFTKESGEQGCMQHTGILFEAAVMGEPATTGDGLDSNGAVWIDVERLSSQNATPFVLMGVGKEMISLATENDEIADVGIRGALRPENRYPMIAAVLLFNSKGNLILSRVAQTKRTDPGKWSYSAAGHVDAGENYKEAAIRELKEELNIDGKIETDLGTICIKKENGQIRAFHHVFKVVSDNPITPDPTEISEIRKCTPLELEQLIKEKPDEFRDIFKKAVQLLN